jgi:hypothetical protein
MLGEPTVEMGTNVGMVLFGGGIIGAVASRSVKLSVPQLCIIEG